MKRLKRGCYFCGDESGEEFMLSQRADRRRRLRLCEPCRRLLASAIVTLSKRPASKPGEGTAPGEPPVSTGLPSPASGPAVATFEE